MPAFFTSKKDAKAFSKYEKEHGRKAKIKKVERDSHYYTKSGKKKRHRKTQYMIK